MIVIESQYYPSLEFFSLIKNENEILIDGNEYFVKQTYRNRCKILTSNKVLTLSVPVRGANRKIPTNQIRIDYSENWIKDHWRGIESAYRRSPYFEFYEDNVHRLLLDRPELLVDLNQSILSFCLDILQLNVKISYSERYIESMEKGFGDFRSVIHPKSDYSERNIYTEKPYTQTFGNKFASNLSILDLIFCCGPEAQRYI